MRPINCHHVGPSGTTCRRVAYNRMYYCRPHLSLYPDAEPRADVSTPPETEQTETSSEPSKPAEPEEEYGPTDWDELQEEGGWWDTALVDATPEERKKEALANAEVAERSLKAEEIYTVASLGGEVTDEMFGRDLSSSIIMGGITGFAALIAIPFLPVILMMILAASVGGNVGSGGGDFANDTISSMSQALWKLQFFAVFISGGALLGFSNHRKRMEALTKGKADFIAEGPLMDS